MIKSVDKQKCVKDTGTFQSEKAIYFSTSARLCEDTYRFGALMGCWNVCQ